MTIYKYTSEYCQHGIVVFHNGLKSEIMQCLEVVNVINDNQLYTLIYTEAEKAGSWDFAGRSKFNFRVGYLYSGKE